MKLRLRAIGSSTGTVFPKEMLRRPKVKRGDEVFAVETPDGYLVTRYDPAVAEQVKLGREFMGKHRDTFRALAK